MDNPGLRPCRPLPALSADAGRDIAKGTLRNILAIIGMDAKEFQKLL